MNLPNKLTVIRIILVPVFMAAIIFPIFPGDVIWRLVAAGLFGIAGLTDMIDGKIARKYNLVTDLGKFLDPLADKIMVLGALIALLVRYSDNTLFCNIMVWVTFIVLFREFAVTSLRLIAAQKSGKVIAAAFPGKAKTVTQIVFVVCALLEGLLPFETNMIISLVIAGIMTVMTIWSGVEYFKTYLPEIIKK